MPNTPEHTVRAVQSNWEWWSDNGDEMNERFIVLVVAVGEGLCPYRGWRTARRGGSGRNLEAVHDPRMCLFTPVLR